ncbi:hypothetical protein [Sphingomonas aerolata]|uniref:hypothetical protein n=1 Tax=Sphingomonas aerolata TaxID=185951 RepID=UPI00334FC57D
MRRNSKTAIFCKYTELECSNHREQISKHQQDIKSDAQLVTMRGRAKTIEHCTARAGNFSIFHSASSLPATISTYAQQGQGSAIGGLKKPEPRCAAHPIGAPPGRHAPRRLRNAARRRDATATALPSSQRPQQARSTAQQAGAATPAMD